MEGIEISRVLEFKAEPNFFFYMNNIYQSLLVFINDLFEIHISSIFFETIYK